jgi:hypothetical protein
VNLFRKEKNAKVIIYMFGKYPWFVANYYNAERKSIDVEYYKSNAYISKFESQQ